MEIHPRENDLVLGTHGRGLWILDDIVALRMLAADPGRTGRPVFVAPPRPAILREVAEAIGYRSTGMAMWQWEARAYGALLTWGVHPDADGERADVEVVDAAGRTVMTTEREVEGGLNRWAWNLRAGGEMDESPDAAEGMEVFPGHYTVRVTVDGITAEAPLEVVDDPREASPTLADRRERVAAYKRILALDEDVDAAQDRLDAALEEARSWAGDDGPEAREAQARQDALEDLREALFTGPECQGICPGDPVADAVGSARSRIGGGRGAVTPLEERFLARAAAARDEVVARVDDALDESVPEGLDGPGAAGRHPGGTS